MNRTIFVGTYRDLNTDWTDCFETGRDRKIVLELHTESVAVNAIWRLIDKIPESKTSLPVYSRILLVAAAFKINFFLST